MTRSQPAYKHQDSRQPLELGALNRVLQHHARTCTFWIFSGNRACSCGVIAARLELQKIREMFANVNILEGRK